MKQTTFNELLKKELRNKEFKQAWDNLEPEFQLVDAILTARKERSLTQKELSELTGITQTDISKIENGNANPSLATLKRLAKGLGKEIRIEFVAPKTQHRAAQPE